jgi:hypothetical protein
MSNEYEKIQAAKIPAPGTLEAAAAAMYGDSDPMATALLWERCKDGMNLAARRTLEESKLGRAFFGQQP